MVTAEQFEHLLLNAAIKYDMDFISDIVNVLTPEQKASINAYVFDEVLLSIARHMELDPAATSATALVFMRTVGKYTSSESVSVAKKLAKIIISHKVSNGQNCDNPYAIASVPSRTLKIEPRA